LKKIKKQAGRKPCTKGGKDMTKEEAYLEEKHLQEGEE
jgi:hypothetical protein